MVGAKHSLFEASGGILPGPWVSPEGSSQGPGQPRRAELQSPKSPSTQIYKVSTQRIAATETIYGTPHTLFCGILDSQGKVCLDCLEIPQSVLPSQLPLEEPLNTPGQKAPRASAPELLPQRRTILDSS